MTLYTLIDMEYPRLGLIHIENFDSTCKHGAGRVLLATADENIFSSHHRATLAHGSGRSDGNDIRMRGRPGTIRR
jgi:hypothetical protein